MNKRNFPVLINLHLNDSPYDAIATARIEMNGLSTIKVPGKNYSAACADTAPLGISLDGSVAGEEPLCKRIPWPTDLPEDLHSVPAPAACQSYRDADPMKGHLNPMESTPLAMSNLRGAKPPMEVIVMPLVATAAREL